MKRILSFLFAFALAVSILPTSLFAITANAETETITLGDCTYTISNGTAKLISCEPSDGISSFSIPSSFYYSQRNYTVTAIGYNAFYGCQFTNLSIPKTVTDIAPGAFNNCQVDQFSVNYQNPVYSSNVYTLNSFFGSYYYGDLLNKDQTILLRKCTLDKEPIIPDGVTAIGPYAFKSCRLTSITIPDSVTSIGYSAFSDCPRLTDIIVPNSVTTIEDYAFYHCNSLNIWYQGTSADKQNINIGNYNSDLTNAEWHYNTCKDEHTYVSDCDISCNRCEWIRSSGTSHSFDDGCDATCNTCDFVRIDPEHIYDNDCDAVCNRCELQRTVGNHRYTLNGELTCSSCKYSRTPNVPELVSYQSGITLKAYEGLEYSQDGINWQDSNVFPNSQSKTFYQRVKASTIAQESSVSPVMELCTIYFDGNGGSDVPENICFVLGTEVSLPTAIPTKSGFVFVGWNTTEYTTSFDPGETVSFSDDIVLYAMWDVGCSVCNYDGRIAVHCYCSSPYLQTVYTCICNSCNTYVTYYDPQCNVCGSLKEITYEWFCGNCRRNLGDDICDNCDGLGRILQAAPTVISYNHSSVMLLEKAGYEYSYDGITWQTSPIFTGLEPNHRYTFYQRQATTETKPFGTTSSGITITSDRCSVSAIPELPTLNSRTATSITLNTVEGCEYSNDGINWQWSNTFSGLNCGTEYTFYQRYAQTDTAYAGKSSAGATFKTDKGTHSKPSAPTLSGKTYNSVTLYASNGYEYSRDGVNWQTSNVFTGLDPETNYMFYQRKAETQTCYASEASTALTVKTAELPSYCTIVFKNWNGDILSSNVYNWGAEVYAPAEPTKAADDIYTYTFAGWDKEVVNCAGDATYTATFTPVYIDYTVVFKNWDGADISSKTYHWGDTVEEPAKPERPNENNTTFTFAGWDKEITACNGDKVYTATYKSWQFADVSTSSWQINAVVYACNRGLMAGKGTDGNGKIKFDPNSPISREEFAQVLYNAENKPSVTIANRFPDVANDGWYKNAVLWANQAGIASGMGDGRFGVGMNITRQDLAMMLYKYAKMKGYSLEAEEGKIYQFADGNKVADYAKTAMDWAVTNSILSGKGDAGKPLSTFRLDPTGTATRAECAAMLKNFMEAFGL